MTSAEAPSPTLERLRVTVSRLMQVLIAGLAAVCLAVFAARWSGGLVFAAAGTLAVAGLGLLTTGMGRVDTTARIGSSAAVAALVAFLTLALEGSVYQIDMHMAFFAGLAIIALWCCWSSVVAYTALVAVHHLGLNFLYPLAVFPEGADVGRVVIHAVILLAQAAALIWLCRRLASSLSVSDAALVEARVAGDRMAAAAANARELTSAQTDRQARLDTAIAAFNSHVAGALHDVRSGMRDLALACGSVDNAAGGTVTMTDQAAESSQAAVTSIAAVAAAADQLSTSVEELARKVGETAAVVGEVSGEARSANEAIGELNAATDKIGTVVALIQSIAEQTNLLALNATIEAARAGEAGKGFAVVASEVKQLASQTAKATDEIAQQIAAVQQLTRGAVGSIEGISSQMGRIDHNAASVAAGIEEQAAAVREINRSIGEMRQLTVRIETAVGDIAEKARASAASSGAMRQTSASVEKSASGLGTAVEEFLAKVG